MSYTEEEERLGEKIKGLWSTGIFIAKSVWEIYQIRLDGRDVAVKKIEHDEESSTESDTMAREWKLQKELSQGNHPNVLKLEAIGCTADFK